MWRPLVHPVDAGHTADLAAHTEYFIELVSVLPQLAEFPKDRIEELRAVYTTMDLDEAARVKALEATTNHDVKAVECAPLFCV